MRRLAILIATLATLGLSALTADGAAAAPASSGEIAYTSDAPLPGSPAGTFHIFVMNTDGAAAAVTRGVAGDVDPAWSPDGTKIAFARETSAGNYDIWVMNADGSGQRRLTAEPRDDRYPAWSPNGDQIAYRGYASATGGSQIFTMRADGSGQAPTRGTFGGDQPTWSPDGTRIAFTDAVRTGTNPDGTAVTDDEIYVARVDGSGAPVDLTNDPGVSDRYAAWSPNGDTIAFRRLDPAHLGRELYSVSAATPGALRDLSTVLGIGRAASWSPDGSSLVFVSYRDAEKDQEIWLSSLDGRTLPPRQLTFNSFTDDEPRWANVPIASSPVPASSGGTSGVTSRPVAGARTPTAGGASVTVGGGIIAGGRRALSLTLHVSRRQRLRGRHHDTLLAYARCNKRCRVLATAVAKRSHSRRALKLFKSRRTARAGRRITLRLRLASRTLRTVRRALRHHRRVTATITATARTSAGEFTPAARRGVTVRPARHHGRRRR